MADYSDDLVAAYLNTRYRVPHFDLTLKIGEANPVADAILLAHRTRQAAFLTAWNPRSSPLPVLENQKRNETLETRIASCRLRYFSGLGIPPEGENWTAEESFFILHIDLASARGLAEAFEQNAFVYLSYQQPPQLIWVD